MNSSSTCRRNSFSSFVKNLLLLVSPSNNVNEDHLERKISTSSSEYSPFQDMYFSFPAFEEPEESSTCGQSHHQPYIAKSNRILC
jgi:hypothetical protein